MYVDGIPYQAAVFLKGKPEFRSGDSFYSEFKTEREARDWAQNKVCELGPSFTSSVYQNIGK